VNGRVVFAQQGWDDYCSWVDDRKTLRKINRMIDEAVRDPGVGIGKPEKLSANLAGYWSRRITDEHRLVYRTVGEDLVVIQARYHY
jgi:toxin YoeB